MTRQTLKQLIQKFPRKGLFAMALVMGTMYLSFAQQAPQDTKCLQNEDFFQSVNLLCQANAKDVSWLTLILNGSSNQIHFLDLLELLSQNKQS